MIVEKDRLDNINVINAIELKLPNVIIKLKYISTKLKSNTMFKPGQKVVCIKESKDLTKNEIYTIKKIICGIGVTLKEITPSDGYIGFHIWRFAPLDTAWAEDILRKILEENN